MRVLGIPVFIRGRCSFGSILFAVLFSDIRACCRICLLRNSGRIRTQIGNKTDRAAAAQTDSFIQLLRDLHRLAGGHVQHTGGFLLQGTGRERQRCLPHPLPAPDILHFPGCTLQFPQDLLHASLIRDRHFFPRIPVKMRCQRFLTPIHTEINIQCPVLFRNKGGDLFLAVRYDAQSG